MTGQEPMVPDVSVVVPVYNEGATLAELIERTTAVLARAARSYEIVVVDDGSEDATPHLLVELTQKYPHLRTIRLVRNFGQNAALTCGLFAARGAFVVSMDGDLQNPPEEIPTLLRAFGPGVDLVSGLRAQRHEPWWRWLGSRAVHWIARALVGGKLGDYGGQFKAYRRETIEATRPFWAPGKPFFALAVWLGFRVREVPVRHEPRRHGGTRYGFVALARLNLEIITSFTTAPLLGLWLLPPGCLALSVVAAFVGWWRAAEGWWLVSFGVAALALATAGLAALGLYIARLYHLAAGGRTAWVERPHQVTPESFPWRSPFAGTDHQADASTKQFPA
jgi:glycosyltransferase involved in cell wall biosynthesis